MGLDPRIATLLRPVRDSDRRTPRGTGFAARALWRPFPVVIPLRTGTMVRAHARGFGGVSPHLPCRFWLGFLGGGGVSPLSACGPEFGVSLIASLVVFSRQPPPFPITAPPPVFALRAPFP